MYKKIIIAGGGTAGWMSAALLSSTLGRAGHKVCLVESPNIASVGVGEATIPSFVHFNRLLGIDEKDLIKKTKATFKLGIQFTHWDKPNSDYIHGFSGLGDQGPGLPFYHYWLRWQKRHNTPNIEDYFLASSMARQGKFVHPDPKIHPMIGALGYAYHIDAGLYAEYLKDYAIARGIEYIQGDIENVNIHPDSGHIASLTVNKQNHRHLLDGDFFIDCTGFKALLIGEALQVPFVSWQKWLKCDSAQVVQSELNGSNNVPFTRAQAHDAGWQWRIPLQHRVGNGIVYSSDYMSDEDAGSLLMSNLDGQALTQSRKLNFTAGMRARFWEKNCLAVGLSSGFLEPLESTSIHLIQSTITRLSLLFPNAHSNQVLAKQFNQQAKQEMEKIRDFIILHYYLNTKQDKPFWRYCASLELPDSLQHKIELYRQSAYIHHEHNDVFTEGSWLSVLVGQGLLPMSSMHMINTMDDTKLDEYMQNVKNQIATLCQKLPPHDVYMQKMLASKI